MHRTTRLAALLGVSLAPIAVRAQATAIHRLRIVPVVREFTVGDSLRIVAQALDSTGREVSGAVVRFVPAGGWFRGGVDSLGWVRAGAPGVIPMQVVATAGGGRPLIERVEVRVLPGPAARIEVAPRVAKLVVGQRARLGVRVTSGAGDEREDRVALTSSAPTVVRVDGSVLTGRAPGTATIRARRRGRSGVPGHGRAKHDRHGRRDAVRPSGTPGGRRPLHGNAEGRTRSRDHGPHNLVEPFAW